MLFLGFYRIDRILRARLVKLFLTAYNSAWGSGQAQGYLIDRAIPQPYFPGPYGVLREVTTNTDNTLQ